MDAGTMWDVIEHIVDPRPVVRDLVRKIRPGGALVIETPDANFPVRPALRWLRCASRGRIKLSGKMYYWEHKVYFTEEGLSRLVRSEGCEVVKVLRMNSPHVKMTKIFQHSAAQGNLAGRVLYRTWPFLDGATRRLGLGNKLILVARTARSRQHTEPT